MLHPVGPLPAAVYWRRRLLVLTLLVALLGGGGWLGGWLLTGRGDAAAAVGAAAGTSTAQQPASPPALERVVPSLASVRTPTPAPTTTPPPAAPASPPGPQPGSPCSDEMISVEVRSPGSAPAGSRPTFELVVTNVSPVPCVRTLDKGLQEIVLLDPAGNRLWGSNDCYPEAGSDTRTLEPGEAVASPLVWSGLTSQPGCAGDRTQLGPGQYVLRGRMDTKASGDAPFVVV